MTRTVRSGGMVTALCLMAGIAAAEVQSLDVLRHMPVLEGGRLVPMDSYARHTLLALAGHSTHDRQPAITWLARVMFAPELATNDAVFLVNNPEVIEALGLPAHGRRRYSIAELEPVFGDLTRLARSAHALDEDARSPVEQELLRLFSNLSHYTQLSRSFAFAVPQPDFDITDAQLRRDLGLADGAPVSFLDLHQRLAAMRPLLEQAREDATRGTTPYQDDLLRVAAAFRMWSQMSEDLPPRLVPMPHAGPNDWGSGWDLLRHSAGAGEDLQREVTALGTLAACYRTGRQLEFDLAARTFMDAVSARAPQTAIARKLKMEVRYNDLDLFYRAELCYGLAFLAAMLSLIWPRRGVKVMAVGLVVLGLLPHTAGILARMAIMGRPPVTNLYATFVFVSWVCVLLGLILEYMQRNRLGVITASATGLALLLTSARFAQDGDTLGVVVAVLDSNFWLATHVVCISIGYAGCCVAGLIGHIYLLQALRRAPDDPDLKETDRAVYGTLAFGLIFSFLGTMLGGVWADQSWGRFWGWDPKENGALVIVLWSAILFHARSAKLIGPLAFSAGSVLGVITVLLAWLGVNLLGVGLHSYGFTSGLARGLMIACAFELVFVLLTTPWAKRAPRAAP